MAKFKVEVITTKRDNPDLVQSRKVINYNSDRDRGWLGAHSNWALRNGYAVHTAEYQGN